MDSPNIASLMPSQTCIIIGGVLGLIKILALEILWKGHSDVMQSECMKIHIRIPILHNQHYSLILYFGQVISS